MVLNGFLRAPPPATNSFLSPSSTDMACLSPVGPTHLRQLGISNGCQDHTAFAVRFNIGRLRGRFDRSRVWLNPKPALQVTCTPDAVASTASRPASMTMANAPLRDGTARDIEVIWVRREGKCFCKEDWTGQITTDGLHSRRKRHSSARPFDRSQEASSKAFSRREKAAGNAPVRYQ